jgi:hypothetical protein
MTPEQPSHAQAGSPLRAEPAQYRRDTAARLRLVYIPTHRPFGQVLARVAEEIRRASRQMGNDELQLLVVDDRPAGMSAANRMATARVAESAEFAVNWVGTDEWSAFIERLLRAADLSEVEARSARAALLKESGSYAGGMNKASLFAAYLGAESLHRRDSDEFPGFRESDDLTALQVEAAALATPAPGGEAPYFAGSNVHGEPTKDHRDLAAVSPGLVDEIERISSRKTKWRSAARRDKSSYFLRAGTGVEVECDLSGRTEVGVSATRAVFEWIPEMPAIGVLGTDHFQKGLLYQLGLPVLWHPLAATHVYDLSRLEQRDADSVRRYVLAELRHCVLKQYWNAANDSLRSMAAHLVPPEGGFRSDLYANVFSDVLHWDGVHAEAAADAFIAVYERALAMSSGDVKARHEARADALASARDQVVGYVRAAVEEFAELTRQWPRLVAAVRAMHPA